MGNKVEARAQRVRNHLQRPDHPDRQLTNAKVRSTVNQTAPCRRAGFGSEHANPIALAASRLAFGPSGGMADALA
jgi:hypothetical protein